jgi:EmrB/QacA subfamily drug resistance transporter
MTEDGSRTIIAKMRARLLAPENRKWLTLAAVTFGLFMIMLDNTIVNVALPSIQRDLGTTVSQLEWVVNGYALTFAVLMLTGGKLADMLGRRLIFIVGLAVFTASSLACGLAGTEHILIAARVVQGVGAALMNPATLSIIRATFPSRQRGMAIGIWAGVSASALAIGPLIGGVLTEHIGWSWIFFINVPVGLLGIVVARLAIAESRDTSHEQRLDLPGLLTSALALFALIYGLIEANNYGWTSVRILSLFGVAAIALAVFVALEIRQRLPMLDLSLFRNPTFAGANVTMMLVTLAMFGVFFFVSLYMQNILGYSATQAGATFLPMTVLIVLIAPAAGRLSDRIGSRWLMGSGMTLLGCSLLLFSRLDQTSTFWTVLPGLLVGGLGMGLTMTPATAAGMGSVPVDKAGVGSAVLNSTRQVGGTLGIAVMGAIVASYVTVVPTDARYPAEFVTGFQRGLEVSAGIAFAAAILAVLTVRKDKQADAGDLAAAVAAAAESPQEARAA